MIYALKRRSFLLWNGFGGNISIREIWILSTVFAGKCEVAMSILIAFADFRFAKWSAPLLFNCTFQWRRFHFIFFNDCQLNFWLRGNNMRRWCSAAAHYSILDFCASAAHAWLEATSHFGILQFVFIFCRRTAWKLGPVGGNVMRGIDTALLI